MKYKILEYVKKKLEFLVANFKKNMLLVPLLIMDYYNICREYKTMSVKYRQRIAKKRLELAD